MAIDYDPFSRGGAQRPAALVPAPARRGARLLHGAATTPGRSRASRTSGTRRPTPTRYSAARGTTPAQLLTRDQPVAPMINLMDPPQHTQLRAVIRHGFLPSPVRALEPVARKLAGELLDAARDRGGFDAVAEFGARISVTMACLAIGLPVDDGPLPDGPRAALLPPRPATRAASPPTASPRSRSSRATASDMVRERRRAPARRRARRSTRSSRFEQDGRRFGDEEAASHVSMLVIGGSETFPKVLANGLLRLARAPRPARAPGGGSVADPRRLRRDPPLRHADAAPRPHAAPRRRAARPDACARASPWSSSTPSANHDPREFADPDRFDVARRPARILTFGAGAHQCLGRHVARMEGRVCFEEILARFPDYEVELERAVRLHTEFVQGFASLPLRSARPDQ